MTVTTDPMDDIFVALKAALKQELGLRDKNIVVTGKLMRFDRNQVKHAIISKGGSSSNTVTKTTAALVVGDRPGQVKVSAAILKGIPIITEDDLMAMLQEV